MSSRCIWRRKMLHVEFVDRQCFTQIRFFYHWLKDWCICIFPVEICIWRYPYSDRYYLQHGKCTAPSIECTDWYYLVIWAVIWTKLNANFTWQRLWCSLQMRIVYLFSFFEKVFVFVTLLWKMNLVWTLTKRLVTFWCLVGSYKRYIMPLWLAITY